MRLARHYRWLVGIGLLLVAPMPVWYPAWKLPRAIPAVVLAGPGSKSEEWDDGR